MTTTVLGFCPPIHQRFYRIRKGDKKGEMISAEKHKLVVKQMIDLCKDGCTYTLITAYPGVQPPRDSRKANTKMDNVIIEKIDADNWAIVSEEHRNILEHLANC